MKLSKTGQQKKLLSKTKYVPKTTPLSFEVDKLVTFR